MRDLPPLFFSFPADALQPGGGLLFLLVELEKFLD